LFEQIILLAILGPPTAGSIIAAKTAITKITASTSTSVSPLIFALAESVFMADETVTPPAPAASPKI
jgi:hypothetical protein